MIHDAEYNCCQCRSFGFKDRIFKRRTVNGRRTHAKRGVVERYFSWLDKNRRLLVRYEQTVTVYIALTFLASGIRLANVIEKKIKLEKKSNYFFE